MALNIDDLQLGVKVSAYGTSGFLLGIGNIEGYCLDGNVVGKFPDGACKGDMVFVSLNAELPHPKVMSVKQRAILMSVIT